jgi:hypothetical protein
MAVDSGQIADTLAGPALHDAKRVLRDQVLAARDALDPQGPCRGIASDRGTRLRASVVLAGKMHPADAAISQRMGYAAAVRRGPCRRQDHCAAARERAEAGCSICTG